MKRRRRRHWSIRDIFGEGNYFLELQDHGIPDQQPGESAAAEDVARSTGIELVATNDVHYTYAEDAKAHDILLCIQTGKKLADENRMRYEGGQYYVKSPGRDGKAVPLCAARRWTIPRRSLTAVMWRLSSA